MIKAIAIDDEPLALKVLQNYCSQSEDLVLDKTFTQTKKALDYLSENQVDLIFTDIQMPGLLGTDFVRKLQVSPMIVFTTAFSEFAVEGFELNAIDYLLKPFTEERFQQCLNKVKEYQNYLVKQEAKVKPNTILYLKADYSLIRVKLEEVQYIEAYDDYLKIFQMNQKPLVVRMTMKNIMEKLPEDQFVRIHRSYIVSIPHIQKRLGGKMEVAGKELPIGAMYKDALKDIIEEA